MNIHSTITNVLLVKNIIHLDLVLLVLVQCPNYNSLLLLTIHTCFLPFQQPALIFTPRDNIQPQKQITTSSNSIKLADKNGVVK